MTDERLILAFSEPPSSWGFRRAKSGKCWFRKIEGLVWAKKLAAELVALGIHGVIKKIDGPTPRGGPAREQHAEGRRAESKRQAMAIYEAGVLAGRKEARAKSEEHKRTAELQRQALRRAQTEHIKRAAAIGAEVVAAVRPPPRPN